MALFVYLTNQPHQIELLLLTQQGTSHSYMNHIYKVLPLFSYAISNRTQFAILHKLNMFWQLVSSLHLFKQSDNVRLLHLLLKSPSVEHQKINLFFFVFCLVYFGCHTTSFIHAILITVFLYQFSPWTSYSHQICVCREHCALINKTINLLSINLFLQWQSCLLKYVSLFVILLLCCFINVLKFAVHEQRNLMVLAYLTFSCTDTTCENVSIYFKKDFTNICFHF